LIKSELVDNGNEFDTLTKDIKLLGVSISDPKMQLYRAKKFRDYTVHRVEKNTLSLKRITRATKVIDGKNHPPEWNKGSITSKMSSRQNKDGSAEAGFFNGSELVPGKNITVTQAMILQHTGYRIPLTGEKGARVRKWLAWKGVFSELSPNSAWRKTKIARNEGWIIVRPRPFMFISARLYSASGLDEKAAVEYMRKKGGE